jgi:hypothetical protein
MTASRLQEIVLRLANVSFVRYHLHWNHPCRNPWVMAIQARDREGRPVHVLPLDAIGFEWDEDDRMHFIDRTNDDGTPSRPEP